MQDHSELLLNALLCALVALCCRCPTPLTPPRAPAPQAAVQDHFEEHERHFNSVPAVRFTGIVNPFKAEITVSWTYNFGPSQVGARPCATCHALHEDVLVMSVRTYTGHMKLEAAW
jgi:hypothetical protein